MTTELSNDPPLLRVNGLSVRFGGIVALDGISFDVRRGQVCGVIGPNGAGKTTLFNCLSRLYTPHAGTIAFDGEDLLARPQYDIAAAGIGRTFQNVALFPAMTVRENVMVGRHCRTHTGYFANAFRLPSVRREELEVRERTAALLELLDLATQADTPVRELSFGTRKRVEMARALVSEPKLLLLDEPATGLDPAGMRDMRLLIRRLADQGMTVLLSSHLLAEVEELCNRVAIVRKGKIVYEGAIAELKRGAGATYRLSSTDDERALAVCRAQPGITDVRVVHGRISFAADEATVADLSQALIEAGALIKSLAPQSVTLEDLFFSLTEGDGVGDGFGAAGRPAATAEASR
jgi:branched-chain amino acid transport system ATP-binding protein